MKENPLIQLGNVPVQTGTIAACFDYLAAPNEKVRALEKDGQLIRLKRGLYVVDERVSGKPINVRLCANHIYGPSYVSLQWALRWYGLIPERVFTMTSITTKRTREFENSLGRFTYYQVKPSYFPIGIRSVEENGVNCLMAGPEKARALEKNGQIIRLKKELYVASKMETGKELSMLEQHTIAGNIEK